MSGLCRHNESYEHNDANRHAETVIKSQIVYQFILKYPITLNAPGIKQSDTQLKMPVPNGIKKLGIYYLPH